jgi:hypothetical protein
MCTLSYKHRLPTDGAILKTIHYQTSSNLLIGWVQLDGSHSALSFNTLVFRYATAFLYPHAGCWVLTGILVIKYTLPIDILKLIYFANIQSIMELFSGKPQLQLRKYSYYRRKLFESFIVLNLENPVENYSLKTRLWPFISYIYIPWHYL